MKCAWKNCPYDKGSISKYCAYHKQKARSKFNNVVAMTILARQERDARHRGLLEAADASGRVAADTAVPSGEKATVTLLVKPANNPLAYFLKRVHHWQRGARGGIVTVLDVGDTAKTSAYAQAFAKVLRDGGCGIYLNTEGGSTNERRGTENAG